MLLLAAEGFLRRDGELFALALGIYAVTRFLIEMLRTDEAACVWYGHDHRTEHQPGAFDIDRRFMDLYSSPAGG